MGSFIGGLITRKKRKKIARQQKAEFALQAQLSKEQQRIGQLQANYAAQQEKMQQLREARIRRAQVIASGVNAGAGNSSAVEGGASSAYSAALSNVSNLNAIQTYSENISNINQQLAESSARLNVLGVKMDTQNQKSQMIGSIIDTGISLATLPWGGVGGAVTRAVGGTLTGVAGK